MRRPATPGRSCARTCHPDIYEAWTSSRHSYSILTASQARAAGYPLPPSPVVASWDDVAYTIGGRKRIAYADSVGNVLDTAYHHRVGTWRSFPAKAMDCAPCHVTGPGGTDAVELNIGCESCHGPGERHVRSSDRKDIGVDATSSNLWHLSYRCVAGVAGRRSPRGARLDSDVEQRPSRYRRSVSFSQCVLLALPLSSGRLSAGVRGPRGAAGIQREQAKHHLRRVPRSPRSDPLCLYTGERRSGDAAPARVSRL